MRPCSCVVVLASALLSAAWVADANAQSFPSGQVTIVSPYQPGGTSDIISRELAQRLGALWRQTVVVENKPGANGAIGVNSVVKANPDGHTLLAVASSALTLNPIMLKNIAYDVARDLAPLTRTGAVPNVLVVHPSVPAKSVAELVALAKAKPGSLNYASQGIGSNGHVTGELFKLQAGVEMTHVPYKGSAPAVADLVGGHTQLMFDNLPSVLGQITTGQLRALAVTTEKPSAALPDVPPLAQAGLPGFDTSAWFAVLTTKATPEPIRAQLEKNVIEVLSSAEAKAKLSAVGVDVVTEGAAELSKRIDAETKMWRDVVEKAGIKVN